MGREIHLPLKITRRRVAGAALSSVAAMVLAGWFASRYYSFEARFARSRPSLDGYAAQAMASYPQLPRLPAHLGSFETSRLERLPHGFLFFCDYGHPLDANGLAYSTESLPDVRNHDYFTHIEGNWYLVLRN